MFNEIGEVYNLLGDEESKEIFLNRTLYNITRNKYYIDKISSIYFERLKKKWETFQDNESVVWLREKVDGRKVIVYGIGQGGFAALALFDSIIKNIDLRAFCDQKASIVLLFRDIKL